MSFQHLSKPVHRLKHDASSQNITTSAWVQLDASLDKPCSGIKIYNGTGSILEFAIGGSGSEVAQPYYLPPEESSPVLPINLSYGSRLSLKAVDKSATQGHVIFNFFG